MKARVEDMHDDLKLRYFDFKKVMEEKKIPFMLTSVARLYREQVALFSQGRQGLLEVNELRKLVMLPPIDHAQNQRKVTWTLTSKHLINLEDEFATNNKSRAFDFAIIRDGQPVWDLKIDENQSGGSDYDEAGEIVETVGLIWGGRFKPTPDRPHCQLAGS